jgi:hypothetical protein
MNRTRAAWQGNCISIPDRERFIPTGYGVLPTYYPVGTGGSFPGGGSGEGNKVKVNFTL